MTSEILAPSAGFRSGSDAETVLKRLDWQVVRKLDGLLQGDYRSLFSGHGLDLAEVREYQPQDDVRYMDWNVTARMNEPYVRQYLEDREITAWLVLDTSPSVDFGTVRVRKSDLMLEFAGVMARLFTRHGNQIAAVTFSAAVDEVLPPRGGQRQALRMIHELVRPERKFTPGATSLAGILDRVAQTIKRRSLVFIVTDFISAPGWEDALGRRSRRHETIAVWLSDPREEELPDIGPVVLQDAETGEQVYVETQDRRFRARFQSLVGERRRHNERTFARHGIDVLNLSTESDLVRELSRFTLLRRQRIRNQGGAIGRATAGLSG